MVSRVFPIDLMLRWHISKRSNMYMATISTKVFSKPVFDLRYQIVNTQNHPMLIFKSWDKRVDLMSPQSERLFVKTRTNETGFEDLITGKCNLEDNNVFSLIGEEPFLPQKIFLQYRINEGRIKSLEMETEEKLLGKIRRGNDYCLEVVIKDERQNYEFQFETIKDKRLVDLELWRNFYLGLNRLNLKHFSSLTLE